VIGLYYYVVWTARLFTPERAAAPAARRPFPAVWVAIGVAVAVAVLFSVAPQPVLDMTFLSATH
jgi:NADH-quinone oxidoreductase subunit N